MHIIKVKYRYRYCLFLWGVYPPVVYAQAIANRAAASFQDIAQNLVFVGYSVAGLALVIMIIMGMLGNFPKAWFFTVLGGTIFLSLVGLVISSLSGFNPFPSL